MIDLSDEFRQLTSKIYTFSLLCLVAKVLEINSVSQAGVKIEFENSSLVVGALAIMAFLLTLSAMFKLFADVVRTRIADEVHFDEIGHLTPKDIQSSHKHRQLFTEANFNLIKFATLVSFVIEAALPLIAGVFIFWYALQDVVEFLKEVTKWSV